MTEKETLRSLARGLEALELLNRQEFKTISALARALDLPRTTVERILVTLATEGYVEKRGGGRGYRVSAGARGLSSGFSDEGRIVAVASPLLFERTREIGWPLSVVSPYALNMVLRVTTNPATTLWLNARQVGTGVPMAQSGSGFLHLAFAPEAEREALIEVFAGPDQTPTSRVVDLANFRDMLKSIEKAGFAFSPGRGPERAVSVPIFLGGRMQAALVMAYMAKVLTRQKVRETFVPQLQALSAIISERASLSAQRGFAR